MAGGGPGSNSRGRGGKFKKFTRGGQSTPPLIPHPATPKILTTPSPPCTGGKHFSRDLRPLDEDGNEIGRKGPSDAESEEESSSEEESEEESDAGPSTKAPAAAELSREDRKKEKKARKDAAIARSKKPVEVGDMPPSDSDSDDDDNAAAAMPANPNHSRKARQQTKPSAAAAVDDAAAGVEKLSVAPSRREREAMEAAAAKERYRKLHEAGKTDEAKADLARLKLIREKREAEAARKQVGALVVVGANVRALRLTLVARPRRRSSMSRTKPRGPRSTPGKPSAARLHLVRRPRRRRGRNEVAKLEICSLLMFLRPRPCVHSVSRELFASQLAPF